MSLTLRNIKGSPLTYTEMDNNLTYLEGLSSSGISMATLSEVLSGGNETNGNDIILSDGDLIQSKRTIVGGVQTISYVSGTIPPRTGRGTIYVNISQKSTSGTGTGVLINIVSNGTSITAINIINSGQDYNTNDTITISGADLGGIDGTNDVILNVDLSININRAAGITYDISDNSYNQYLFQDFLGNTTEGFCIINSPNSKFFGITEPTSNSTSQGISFTQYPGTDIIETRLENDDYFNTITIDVNGSINPYIELYTLDKNTSVFSEIRMAPYGIEIGTIQLLLRNLPTYTDNSDAISGGATTNQVYKTATGELRIVV